MPRQPHRPMFAVTAAALALALSATLTHAAETAAPSEPDKLTAARAQIAAKKWPAAVEDTDMFTGIGGTRAAVRRPEQHMADI